MTAGTGGADVVVVGAGMAGLVAALQAQLLGARVVLVEKGDEPGGSLALSGGTLWCARTHEDLLRLVPRGDPELGGVLVSDFDEGVAWLRENGATVTLLPSEPHRKVYWLEPGPREFVRKMVERFEAAGGTLMLRSQGWKLLMDSDGSLSGIVVRAAGGLQTFRTRAVILTTGGFQANPEMRARYFGQWADRLVAAQQPEQHRRRQADGKRGRSGVEPSDEQFLWAPAARAARKGAGERLHRIYHVS